MHIQHLTAGEYVTSTWAGGITRQIAIRPPGAQYSQRDFLWRLSSAQVDLEESDFTALPDYRRYIAVLAGEIRLSHQGGPWIELPAFRVHAFDGAHATRCLGRCTDFNLMLRKGRCEGSMAALELPALLDVTLPEAIVQTGAAPAEALVVSSRPSRSSLPAGRAFRRFVRMSLTHEAGCWLPGPQTSSPARRLAVAQVQ